MADLISPVHPSAVLTLTFALTVLVSLLVNFWLGARQTRHVRQHRAQVPPPFTDTVTLAAHQKAADYTVTKVHFGLLELTLGTMVLLSWTLLGGLSALNQALREWLGGGLVQQVALVASFVLVNGLIDLPASLYQTFIIEQRFGFNKTTLRLWLLDLLKSSLLGALIGLPFATLILWLMGAAGNHWWLWAWGVWIGFSGLALLIYPTFIAPLFNKFTPLQDSTVKARVTVLMKRCGFTAKGLFVMDGSKRSAHANAYFTGFGASKRVVFYDTLLARLSATEIDAVLAHELGHFKYKHIIKRTVLMFGLSLLAFATLGWLASQAWFYAGLGVQPNLNAPNDALALLLFLLTAPVFGIFITPLFARLSREHEFQADAYAAVHTDGADLASALIKLYEDNASTLTPDPLYAQLLYSHPPASERLMRLARVAPAHSSNANP